MAGMIRTVEDYISQFSPDIQSGLMELRAFIIKTIPDAVEKIAYGMPAYHSNGVLVYFGAFKDHYGIFPGGPVEDDELEKELAPYRTGKGTFCFPFDKPLPKKLIKKFILYRQLILKQKASSNNQQAAL